MMKIRKRWRDNETLQRLMRVIILLGIIYFCFGFALGFYYVSEPNGELSDGDLVVYEKIWRRYDSDDVLLAQGEINYTNELGGKAIDGRVLLIVKIRNFTNE